MREPSGFKGSPSIPLQAEKEDKYNAGQSLEMRLVITIKTALATKNKDLPRASLIRLSVSSLKSGRAAVTSANAIGECKHNHKRL